MLAARVLNDRLQNNYVVLYARAKPKSCLSDSPQLVLLRGRFQAPQQKLGSQFGQNAHQCNAPVIPRITFFPFLKDTTNYKCIPLFWESILKGLVDYHCECCIEVGV